MANNSTNEPQRPTLRRALAAAGLLAVAGALGALWLHQQNPPQPTASDQRNSGRVQLLVPGQAQPQSLYEGSYALLIGASAYRNGWKPLPGVTTDIPEVKAALEKHGFTVRVVQDPTRDQLDAALREFVAQHGQQEGNRLLVYFAGHGESLASRLGDEPQGYIVPVDAPLPQADEARFKSMALSMADIESHVRRIEAKHALFVFDSCFSGTIFRANAQPPDHITDKTSRPVRQFITAGAANQEVPDQSIFRQRFVRALLDDEANRNGDRYITGSELGSYLEDTVTNESQRAQTPRHGKIRFGNYDQGDFVFASLRNTPPAGQAPAGTLGEPEREAWDMAKRRDTAAAYQAYLDAYPGGHFSAAARVALQDPQPTAPVFKDCADCPSLVTVPAGRFTMGSSAAEQQKAQQAGAQKELTDRESPQRQVSVGRFAMGQYAVSRGEFARFVQDRGYQTEAERGGGCWFWTGSEWKQDAQRSWRQPGFAQGDDHPVVCVSWNDAQAYVQWLSQRTGKAYRLPSEAEREYATRAGSPTAFWWGESISTAQANYHGSFSYNGSPQGEYRAATVPVSSFNANPFGLYNVHGNVREWVQDCFEDNYSAGQPTDGSAHRGTDSTCTRRVLRGGSWVNLPQILRSAFREWNTPDNRVNINGFRLARTVP